MNSWPIAEGWMHAYNREDDDCMTGSSPLLVTLDQAIEIHPRALKYRHGRKAPELAREKADHCSAVAITRATKSS